MVSKKKAKGLFIPPQLSFKKHHRASLRPYTYSSRVYLSFGNIGIKILQPTFLGAKQLELLRRFLTRRTRSIKDKKTNLWGRAKPTKPISRKGRGVRMGKGKGVVKYWVAPTSIGMFVTELLVKASKVQKTINFIMHAKKKLPVTTCIVYRSNKNILLLDKFSCSRPKLFFNTAIAKYYLARNRIYQKCKHVRSKREELCSSNKQ